MNHKEQPITAILVIANRTCPCPTLVDEVARRGTDRLAEVLVVAPALNSRLRHWVSDVDGAVSRARDRLELAVSELRERGISARGEVGDSDPLLAIADALAAFPATEIVIATHPDGQSNWLERGLIENASARFDIPITHLVSSYGLVQEGARHEPLATAVEVREGRASTPQNGVPNGVPNSAILTRSTCD